MSAPLTQFLENSGAAAQLMAHARVLLKLARQYESLVPPGLTQTSRVANFKAGKIVIHADNGAVAAKLRQMSAGLCQRFSIEGRECSGLEIKVQPRENPYQSIVSHQKPLSGRSSASLRTVANNMPEHSPLRIALQQLLAHAEIREND